MIFLQFEYNGKLIVLDSETKTNIFYPICVQDRYGNLRSLFQEDEDKLLSHVHVDAFTSHWQKANYIYAWHPLNYSYEKAGVFKARKEDIIQVQNSSFELFGDWYTKQIREEDFIFPNTPFGFNRHSVWGFKFEKFGRKYLTLNPEQDYLQYIKKMK